VIKKPSLLLLFLFISIGIAQASVFDWKCYESDNFAVYFHKGFESRARETIYYLELYKPKVVKLTGNNYGKVTVILEDNGLNSNGNANPINNKMGYYLSSPGNEGFESLYGNWLGGLSIHEQTHIGSLTNATGLSQLSCTIFGNIFMPNIYSPGWIIEGITVYHESHLNKYEGRLNDGLYDAVIASKVKSNSFPTPVIASLPVKTYPIDKIYNYGGAFFRFLAIQYGEDRFADFFNTLGSYYWIPLTLGTLPAIGIDKAAHEVYGKDFPELFSEWEAFEVARHKDWTTDGVQITSSSWYKGGLRSYNNKLYYSKVFIVQTSPYSSQYSTQITEYDPATNEETKQIDLVNEINSPIQIVNNILYYTVPQFGNNYANLSQKELGIVSSLYAYNLTTGKTKPLLKESIRAFCVKPDGEIIYAKEKTSDFGSELVSYKNGQISKIGTIPELISEIELCDDKYIVVSKKNNNAWNINYLLPGSLQLLPIINSSWAEFNISVDKGIIYYTADYDSKYALYAYDLSNGTVAQLTNGGYAKSKATPINDRIYFIGIDNEGEDLFVKKYSPRPYKVQETETITNIDYDKISPNITEYDGFSHSLMELLKPSQRIFPSLLTGEDALGVNIYQVGLGSAGLDITITNKLFTPLTLSFGTQTILNRHRNFVGVTYPVYKSLEEGLSSLEVGFTTNFSSNYIPKTEAVFRYPNYSINFNIMGDIQNKGALTNTSFKYTLNNIGIRSSVSLFRNFDIVEDIRGSNLHFAKNQRGLVAKVDITTKIGEIRDGLWNPRIFAGDMYGGFFVDYSSIKSDRATYGYEFSLETGLGDVLLFVPRVGIAFSGKKFDFYSRYNFMLPF